MPKIGRNAPCPCGSGKKYKKCHGNPLNKPVFRKLEPHEAKRAFDLAQASESIRKQQQGLGRPIIAGKAQGRQFVAVGNKLHSSGSWKTFPDFLSDYIKKTIGEEWGNAELKKPLEQRHPILQWYDKLCRLQQQSDLPAGIIRHMPTTGVAVCYLGLAYNLYLLQHNVELQQRYINRLKDINNFQGAYYELMVANFLIRAGFSLELEDEDDLTTKHCEFSAVSPKTGAKYWIEVKMRSVAGVLGKTKANGTTSKDPTGKLSDHLGAAFAKPADGKRLIFVDLNTDFEPYPAWVERAGKKLDMKEKDLKSGQAAYVFVTNMAYHRHLDDTKVGAVFLAHGLGIPDFAKPGEIRYSEAYRQRQKHVDAHDIMETMKTYSTLPSTFSGKMPSEEFQENPQRINIGEKYFFEEVGENGLIAEVTSATVMESTKEMIIGTDSGHIFKRPMSDAEITDYKNHRDTFFGTYHRQGRHINDPYEFYENMVEIHKEYGEESLHKRVEKWPEPEKWKKMPFEELVLIYCESQMANIQMGKDKNGAAEKD